MIKRVVITVKYNIVGYLISEGFSNLLKNKKSTWAALTIMCMSMFMFGLFFVLGENINYVAGQVEEEQGIRVFLDYDVTATDISQIETEIRSINGTNMVKYISRTEYMNEQKELLGEDAGVLEGAEYYFQDSFLVTLTDLELNSQVQDQIRKIDKVETIESSNETIESLVNITKGIRMVTFAILVILVFISIFIITNTIKLTVHARRKEISIMKYVGATNSFVRTPFVIEGILIGIMSSFLSVVLVGGIYNWCANKMRLSETIQNINVDILSFNELFTQIIIVYVILGVGIGIIGSTISMRKYLDV